ncbi:Cda4 [Drosophila busckii]|uniref:Cda4 n=1 Tax=Drosophila busckii TaxID=30019 RepID=A0A0M5JDR6_DROBS|nr:Cda4 [Drosophila busckii]
MATLPIRQPVAASISASMVIPI